MYKKLKFVEPQDLEVALKHGDIIQVISHERLCGLEKGAFTALIVDTKDYGLIAIPLDFYGHMALAENDGCGWELDLEWLLDSPCEIRLIYSDGIYSEH